MQTVSIIVPVYNVEAFLPQCIESILCQSLSDFELILVDDGSPDRCGEICDDFARRDNRIVVIHQKNSGVAHARNTGLEHASGQYVAFCDSDDTLKHDFLQTLIDTLEYFGVDSVVSSFDRVFADGSVKPGRKIKPVCRRFQSLHERSDYISQQILWKKVGWEVCTRLFRNSIIKDRNIRFCESCDNFAEDLSFVMQYSFFSCGEAAIDYHGYQYFQRSGSMMDTSKSIVKLEQTNAVSKYIYPAFSEVFSSRKDRRIFTLFHLEMLYEQLRKLSFLDPAAALCVFSGIQDKHFFKKQLKGICRYYKPLKELCGKRNTCRMILLGHFARHQRPILFRIERSLLNRLIVYVD